MPSSPSAILFHLGLHVLPDLRVYDRIVLARMAFSLMHDISNVDRIAKQIVQVPAHKRLAATPLTISRTTLLRLQAKSIGFAFHSAHISEFDIQCELYVVS